MKDSDIITTEQTEVVKQPVSRLPVILTLIFLAIAGFGIYNHEMWRDELEIFTQIRDIPGFFALFPDIQPLPNLYLCLLYPTVKLWPHPGAFQLFHLLFITFAVFLFNKYSPFNPVQKIFFTFSYFILFEYGIISREYSMLLFLVFLLVYSVTRRKHSFILVALAFFLLANHHLYGLFASISIFIYEIFYVSKRIKEFTPREKKHLLIAASCLMIASFYLFLQYSLLLRWDRYAQSFGQAPYFMTIRSIWNAFVPLPQTTGMNFWNTNLLPFPQMYSKPVVATQFISTANIVALGASLFILFVNIIIFSRKLPVLIIFLVNTSIQLIFLQYLSVFYVRYQGPLFIVFIYSYWLLAHADEKFGWPTLDRVAIPGAMPLFTTLRKFTSPFVSCLLFLHFCTGIFCYSQDIRYPFTASNETAKYIEAQKLNNNIMVGYIDYVAQTISGHLGQSIYYPQTGHFGTHVVWLDRNRRETLPLHEVLDQAIRIHRQTGKNVLLILNVPLYDRLRHPEADIPLYNDCRLKYLNEFTKSIVDDERFFLYLIYRHPMGG
jgi:hypothetical protein